MRCGPARAFKCPCIRGGDDLDCIVWPNAAGAVAVPASPEPWRWEDSDDAVKAYAALVGVLLLGAVPALQDNKWADLPYFVALALCTQYIGAHRSLTTKQRQQISFKVHQALGSCPARSQPASPAALPAPHPLTAAQTSSAHADLAG